MILHIHYHQFHFILIPHFYHFISFHILSFNIHIQQMINPTFIIKDLFQTLSVIPSLFSFSYIPPLFFISVDYHSWISIEQRYIYGKHVERANTAKNPWLWILCKSLNVYHNWTPLTRIVCLTNTSLNYNSHLRTSQMRKWLIWVI